ncbi:hypothetical protein BS47DRAFT_1385017 [Hydnum rufescens UP504]|uniref:Transposase n=1 Tax=Hydnum rufescens UP504 TaxID=1448309 RepID=A0A9P6AKY3_9AGAM|nr:hypothetical protein BS47DRAFT_1385017 [Hydnum rufescens UP504]
MHRGNHNPSGSNQYGPTIKAESVELQTALREYQHRLIFDNKKISEPLEAEHGIKMSDTTVKQQHKELGILGIRATTHQIPENTKTQLVLDALEDDPSGHHGPKTIQ